MSRTPPRVAFAGLAHSHPYTDAAGVLALGGEIAGVYDDDAEAATSFARRFGGAAVDSAEALTGLGPDVIIVTVRPDDAAGLIGRLAEGRGGRPVPMFANKVVAATLGQLEAWDQAATASPGPVGTASVLRFAPALMEFSAVLAEEELLAIRVHVQHDNVAFFEPGRSWQDEPRSGGGTLVTVGVHAWEMIDTVLPGAELCGASGWTRRRVASATRSEDAAGIVGALRPCGESTSAGSRRQEIPVQVLVTGVPGPDCYVIEAFTANGVHELRLDVDDALEALGFRGLIRAVLAEAAEGRVHAPWPTTRRVLQNCVTAAQAARGECA